MKAETIRAAVNRPKRKGLGDTIKKIVRECPSCKKRRDSKTLDR